MPYGLKTALQTFQKILNDIFSDMLYNWVIIYNDDLIVWSDNETKALQHYDQVFQHAIDFGIQFKPTKCASFSQDLQVLGHRITPQQVDFQPQREQKTFLPCPILRLRNRTFLYR